MVIGLGWGTQYTQRKNHSLWSAKFHFQPNNINNDGISNIGTTATLHGTATTTGTHNTNVTDQLSTANSSDWIFLRNGALLTPDFSPPIKLILDNAFSGDKNIICPYNRTARDPIIVPSYDDNLKAAL